MIVSELATKLTEFSQSRRSWRQLGGTYGLVLNAWRSPERPDQVLDWEDCYRSALGVRAELAKYYSTLGAAVDSDRVHRNLCALCALGRFRCSDDSAWRSIAEQYVAPAQVGYWLQREYERIVMAPVGLRFAGERGELADFRLARISSQGNTLPLLEDLDVALSALGPLLLATLRECTPARGTFAWSVSLRTPDFLEAPLDGASCGGALRVGFRLLSTARGYDPRCLILTDPAFHSVEGEIQKIDAASQFGITKVLLGKGSKLSKAQLQAYEPGISFQTVASEDEAFVQAAIAISASSHPSEPDDPLYVSPVAFTKATELLGLRFGETLIIRGASRAGKTSLLNHLAAAVTRTGQHFVLVNLHKLNASAFEDSDLLLAQFAGLLLDAAGAKGFGEKDWRSRRTPQQKVTGLVETRILLQNRRVIIAIDQADRLLESSPEVRDNFYRMLRTWHNERATPTPIGLKWRNCSLVFAISADPNRFITDPNSSPFNLGTPLLLSAWSDAETMEFLARTGTVVASKGPIQRLCGGLPDLVRLAAGWLADGATRGGAAGDLERTCLTPDGPFLARLESLWGFIRRRPELERYLRDMKTEGPVPALTPAQELERAWLIRLGILSDQTPDDRYTCELFRRFFRAKFA